MRMFLIAISAVVISSGAHATSLALSDVYLQYTNFSPSVFGPGGETIRYGADATPNGLGVATTGSATTTNLATGAMIPPLPIAYDPGPLDANTFGGSFLICAAACSPSGNNNPSNLTGPWTITFQNAATTPTSVLPLL